MIRHAPPTARSGCLVRGSLLALLLCTLVPAIAAPLAARADEPAPKPDGEPPARKRDAGTPSKPGSDERGAPTGNPECVHVRTEARYVAYGYDHIVEVDNRCEKAVDCTIATDVNPTASNLTVPPGQKRSVTTFRGSPAREFKADVTCKEQG